MTSAAQLRRPLGTGSILTPKEAAAELSMREAEFREWADEASLWIFVKGRRRVSWRRVLEAVGESASDPLPPKRRMLARVPLGD